MAHETAAVWDCSFISYSKESTEYPTYVENYMGHLPYLVQSCTDVAGDKTRSCSTFSTTATQIHMGSWPSTLYLIYNKLCSAFKEKGKKKKENESRPLWRRFQ